MPWSYPDNVPAVARNWTEAEQRACIDAANAVLERTGNEEQAIYACIRAAGKESKAMKHKVFDLEGFKALKEEPEGTFEAIVAVFGNVDSYGDMIVPGAFTESLERWQASGRPIPVIYSHQWENIDAHIGKVLEAKETSKGLYIKGQLDLEEDFAAKVWKRMKNGTLAQFSFAYDVLDGGFVHKKEGEQELDYYELRRLDLFEVGPCLVGANRETELLSVKDVLRAAQRLEQAQKKSAIASHSTETTDAAWDGPANEARVRSGEDLAYYRQIYAWRDPEGDAAVKSSYRFIHHMVSQGGEPGAANVRACSTGIGVLNGGRGGTTIPDADREGVYSHLARHIRDADLEPPELKAVVRDEQAEEIQRLHDAMVVLGAKCSEGESGTEGSAEDEAGSAGKSSGPHPSVIAARIAIELASED